MRKQISKQTYDEERALYNLQNTDVTGCIFAGTADGESAMKESQGIIVQNCKFSLRYPLWHVKDFELLDSCMDDKTRAPIWYAEKGKISDCTIHGPKCLRQCSDIQIDKLTCRFS